MTYDALIFIEASELPEAVADRIASILGGERLEMEAGDIWPVLTATIVARLLEVDDGSGVFSLSVRKNGQGLSDDTHDAAAADVFRRLAEATPWSLELTADGGDDTVAVRSALTAS